ncbi:UDP:flavonoid glycosyltransferase YjiC (YdhE family) [Catenulispora sp. MAP12-49]|uniref:nucleotide disphospho-sugar-binding domain-containing protein n=1 Tax=Catenulispora sp. MAP12-49 TaxID=3156302 RepID=UPI003515C256
MRALITTTPFLSHLWDVVPLGWALRSAGHDVRVAALPNITEDIVATSLTAMPAGPLFDTTLVPDWSGQDDGLLPFASTTARLGGLLAHGLAGKLDDFPPDLVVHEPLDLAGPIIAQLAGVPAVHVSCGPPYAPRAVQALAKAAASVRRRQGWPAEVPPPALIVDVCPPSYADPDRRLAGPHQPMRFVPYNGPGAVPDWLREPADRPRVCVTMGTGAAGHPLLSRIAAALASLDVEVVVPARPDVAAQVAEAVPAARVVEWLPLKLLLAAGCDLVVHHGGPGTALTALSYGVPQLTVHVHDHPAAGEHYINSRLLKACGASIGLSGRAMTDQDIVDAVRALMTESGYRAAAGAMAAEIRAMPSPAATVEVLERLVGQAQEQIQTPYQTQALDQTQALSQIQTGRATRPVEA